MKKNILFIIERLDGGGAERIICELSAELEKTYNTTLVCFNNAETTYRHCDDVVNLNIAGTSNKLRKIVNFFRRIKMLSNIKKQKKIDVSISFIDNANICNVFSGNTYNICSIRTVLSSVAKGKVHHFIEKIVLNRADKVISLSDFVGLDLIRNFGVSPSKVRTIYNPCKVETIQSFSGEKTAHNNKCFTLISAGRFIRAKGQWHLIRVFSEFVKTHPDSKLVLLGEGVLRNELENLAKALSVSNKIELPGFVANPFEVMSNADIFVFTSLWEGFGNAIVEAMACGLPVVCTNCPGGPSEIVGRTRDGKITGLAEYGVLVPAFPQEDFSISSEMPLTSEENSLLVSLCDMYEKKELRDYYSTKSKERANDFCIETICRQWEEIIEKQ